MPYWLVKSEPSVYSIDQFEKDKTTLWDSIRNYQARNFLRSMAVGDLVFLYHSQAEILGIVGLSEVVKLAKPDPTQFDAQSKYYDSQATIQAPRWFAPKLKFVRKFPDTISLGTLRAQKELQDLALLKRGNRLSVQPVTDAQYAAIMKLVTRE